MRPFRPPPVTRLIVLIALAGAVVSPALAQAAGPTFTVPVDLKNLHPAISRARVMCAVNPETGTTAADTIAIGITEFPVSGQAYRGDVAVRTAYQPGKSSVGAKRWVCRAEAYVNGQWQLLGGNQSTPETNAASGYAPAMVSGTY